MDMVGGYEKQKNKSFFMMEGHLGQFVALLSQDDNRNGG